MADLPSLLWHSNAPYAPTGYGAQTKAFASRLADHYQLGISAFYGLEGNVLPWGEKGIPIYPGVGQTHGNSTILDHAEVHLKGARGGLTVSLMDVWVLDPHVWKQLNHAAWTPLDHSPCPPAIAQFFLNSGSVPIAMSKFGQTQLEEAGLDPLYIPHGIDCAALRPIPKAEAREKMGVSEDCFLVGMVAANKGNPSRKCFHEAFQAFKRFHDRHPDSKLYVHTEMTGRFDGVDLPSLMQFVGLHPDAVLFCDQYRAIHYPFPMETMASIYSSLDVLLAASAGEGFGIPVVEAQSCGTPVIVSDFSAQPELCFAGWKVNGRTVYTPLKSHQFLPDIADITECLNHCYSVGPETRKKLSENARQGALEYDTDKVFNDQMLPALEEAAERFEERAPVLVAA